MSKEYKMIFSKKQFLIFILPFFLTSCAKSFFFGEKGGVDAYRVGTLEPLKMPSGLSQDLPQPEEKKTYMPPPSKIVKASQILGIQKNISDDNHIADMILKDKASDNIDFEAFDKEMQAEYEQEQASKDNTVIDRLLGRDKAPIDPVLNEEKEGSLFSF